MADNWLEVPELMPQGIGSVSLFIEMSLLHETAVYEMPSFILLADFVTERIF